MKIAVATFKEGKINHGLTIGEDEKQGRATADDRRLIAELNSRGCQVDEIPWDSPADWGQYAIVLLRSVWDYHVRLEEFLSWCAQADMLPSTLLLNPFSLVKWNVDKRYLLEMQNDGVRVIPSVVFERGEALELSDFVEHQGWREAVIKPVVSLGGVDTWVTSRAQAREDQARVDNLLCRKDIIVQPFVHEVAIEGEVSLCYFGGKYSHAIRKRPAEGSMLSQPEFGASLELFYADTSVVSWADDILSRYAANASYARVDLVFKGGAPVLMELELVEPRMYLEFEARASVRFADALLHALTNFGTRFSLTSASDSH